MHVLEECPPDSLAHLHVEADLEEPAWCRNARGCIPITFNKDMPQRIRASRVQCVLDN